MRKQLLAVFIMLTVILSSLCFSGCYHEENADGLTFITFRDYKTKNPGDFVHKSTDDAEDGYVCRIEKDAPEDIVIPDEFKGKPVCFVTMTDEEGVYPFKSVTFGKNVRAIDGFISFKQEFPNLREIVLPDSLVWISDSFKDIENIEITIPGSVEDIFNSFIILKNTVVKFEKDYDENTLPDFHYDSFSGGAKENKNENVRIIIPDEAKAPLIAESIDDLHEIEIGSKDIFAYSDAVDRESLCRQAKSFFGAVLDESKKIEPAEAKRYASMLDGPIVVTKDCCEDQLKYSSESEPEYISVASMLMKYPEADLIKNHQQPAVYCVAERTQGYSHSYGFTNFAAYTLYEMRYRISLRNIADGELLAWYEVDTGIAPDSKEISSRATRDDIMDKLGYEMGNCFYLRGAEGKQESYIPQPEDCVIPYVFN